MQRQSDTWNHALDCLRQSIPVTLLYVLESRGSSPGRQGFFMTVSADGRMEGSVGGGIMEHKFVELGREMAQSGSPDYQLRKQVHDKSAGQDQSGMICSGEQLLLLYPLGARDLPVIEALIRSITNYRNGTLSLSPAGLAFSATVPPEDYHFSFSNEEDWIYREKTGYKNQLFIAGGGHCALALCRLMRDMDFYITLFEDREGLNTLEKNSYAHDIILLDDYTGLGHMIPSGKNQYLVIMTFGYRTDDMALRSLAGRHFNYLGVLGSRNKMDRLFSAYLEEGFPADWLQRINSPAGLAVNSQTPEEIAVSIAAAIIGVKNGASLP